MLAILARDDALAAASRDRDLYASIAQQGQQRGSELTERSHAKVSLLGAMYGATSGAAAALRSRTPPLGRAAAGALRPGVAEAASGLAGAVSSSPRRGAGGGGASRSSSVQPGRSAIRVSAQMSMARRSSAASVSNTTRRSAWQPPSKAAS